MDWAVSENVYSAGGLLCISGPCWHGRAMDGTYQNNAGAFVECHRELTGKYFRAPEI